MSINGTWEYDYRKEGKPQKAYICIKNEQFYFWGIKPLNCELLDGGQKLKFGVETFERESGSADKLEGIWYCANQNERMVFTDDGHYFDHFLDEDDRMVYNGRYIIPEPGQIFTMELRMLLKVFPDTIEAFIPNFQEIRTYTYVLSGDNLSITYENGKTIHCIRVPDYF